MEIHEARPKAPWHRPPKHLRAVARCAHADIYVDCALCIIKTKRWGPRATSTILPLDLTCFLILAVEVSRQGDPSLAVAHVRGRPPKFDAYSFADRRDINPDLSDKRGGRHKGPS